MNDPLKPRIVKEYVSRNGCIPFRNWLTKLRDARAKIKITRAIKHMELGNFGDHKSISGSGGLYERRIHFGPGYRIYYIIESSDLIVLFAGSDKSDQSKVINKAKVYLADYLARK